MPLTTALYTGMSGLSVNQTALDVIGNNIANVNTTAFKGSRAVFQPEFSETYSYGTQPGNVFGGSNPSQKGLGSRIATIQRNFAAGNIKLTGMATDVAIDGDGMFIVEDAEQYYTRNGQFEINAESYLVNSNGQYVMGYGIDTEYNIQTGSLGRIQIPVNQITVARATSNVSLSGQLGGADLIPASQGTTLLSDDLQHVAGTGTAIDLSTALVDVRHIDPDDGSLTSLCVDGDTIEFTGIRGGREQGPRTLEITAATTVGEYLDFLQHAYGINDDTTLTPAGATDAGVTLIEDANGNGAGTYSIQIVGNAGEDNSLQMDTGAISIIHADQSAGNYPSTFQKTQQAVGDSTHTSFDVYDSLGNPMTVDITFVLEGYDDSGATWRFFANSLDDTDVSTVLGSGEISFDPEGNFINSTGSVLRLDRDNEGVLTPMAIDVDFSGIQGVADNEDLTVNLRTQDGEAAGTLTGFSIVEDGRIVGSFTNGSTRELGQLAIATFSNYAGLIDAGENVFRVGPNSGVAVIGTPMSNGAGSIVSQAIETSNVDLSREFIDMIVASTAFSASSRVITTSNDLLTELMSIVR